MKLFVSETNSTAKMTLFRNLPFISDHNLECDTVYLCLTKSLLVPFPPPILQLLLTQPVSGCISCCTSACLWLGFCVLNFLSILSNFLSVEKLTQKQVEPKAELL